jgi:hypothetical protein
MPKIFGKALCRGRAYIEQVITKLNSFNRIALHRENIELRAKRPLKTETKR